MKIIRHLERMFGQPDSVLCHSDEVDIALWKDIESDDMGMVSTIGMSRHVQRVPPGCTCLSGEPRTELLSFCYLKDAHVFGQLLLDLSSYPFQQHTFLFWWQTLSLGCPLVPRSKLTGVLLTFPPFAEKDVTFHVGQKRVDLILVVPICASELEFCKTKGIDSFEKLLEGKNVDIASLTRKCLV